jgi:sporulation protein YlmC with PRC-barrel domain
VLSRLELGEPVRCTDEAVGELADVVVDPAGKRVTHLVVKPQGLGGTRLVPIELADFSGTDDAVSLRATAEEFGKLPNVERYASLELGEEVAGEPGWDVGVKKVVPMPYDETGSFGGYVGMPPSMDVIYDEVPKGEAELGSSSAVVTADNDYVGQVRAFLVDEGAITHLVVRTGHLWKLREVTVPIDAVSRVESDTMTVALSRDEIDALPAQRVHRGLLHRHEDNNE